MKGQSVQLPVSLQYTTALSSADQLNNFFTPSQLQLACLTKDANITDIGLSGNDGIILSIPWRTNSYGAQIAIDDNNTGTIKIRGMNSSQLGTWHTILTDSNASTYLNSKYVQKAGDTMSGKLQVNNLIFGYQYTNSNNRAAFMLDKPGTGYTGMGANAENSTIAFGPCDANGDWLTEPYQHWKYFGSIWAGGGNDNYGIHPWANNYSTIGTESNRWWKVYATYILCNTVTSNHWNDYAEYRQCAEREAGRVVQEVGDDSLVVTTKRLDHFVGVISDTWGFCQGETKKAKTPIAVAGRVLAYPYEDRNTYMPGDCVCSAPNGTVSKMTREEIMMYPDRIVGTVSCVPDYERWGDPENDRGDVEVDGRIWINIK